MKPYQDVQHVSDVLSSIRQLVSAEVDSLDARSARKGDNVLVLNSTDRVDTTLKLGAKAAVPPQENPELRELVRAIIREELQGDLGDRITRNVRKMVRREIGRALNISLTD
jgi:hypothetical protein